MEQIWGQIILTAATGLIGTVMSLVSLGIYRSKARVTAENKRLQAQLDEQKLKAQAELEKLRADMERQQTEAQTALERAKAEAQVLIIKANEQASARVIAAEGEIRAIADEHALLGTLIKLLSDNAKRDAEKDATTQQVLTQLLDASRKSTDALTATNQLIAALQGNIIQLQTNLEGVPGALTQIGQSIAGLPTQLDPKPMVEGLLTLSQRFDQFMSSLPAAHQDLLRQFIAAVQHLKTETVSETVSELLRVLQHPPTLTLPIEGTTP